MLNANLNNQKGFTLYEMMIVVGIIGVLAMIAIPKYQDYIEKGDMADLKQIMIKVKQKYENDKLALPKSYDTKAKIETAVKKSLDTELASSQLKTKYTLTTNVNPVATGSTVFALSLAANPKDKDRKSVFVDAGGKAYRCVGAITVTMTKPSNCKEAF